METKPLTPMMEQYRRIQAELPTGTILVFRLGDFYEVFFEDAETVAKLCRIALTHRGPTPMAGFPYHARGRYIADILKSGRKVALCDQLGTSAPIDAEEMIAEGLL